MKYSNKQISDLLDGVFSGEISEDFLPDDMYQAIAKYLLSGLYKGFGANIADLSEGVSLDLLEALRTNIYAFSAAKTYQEMREMTALITGEDGEIRTFKAFRDDALEIYDKYNVDWLQTERATAIGQASNAAQWVDIQKQKKTFPLLRYSAVEDANTSDICAPLDGIVLPVDDPFWDEFMPLNHFNCRCVVQQLDEGEVTPDDDLEEITAGPREKISPMFNSNAGKDGMVFDKDHPYFKEVPKEDKAYAKRNFDMPIPEDDE